jgi:hypothetical protein
MPGTGARETGSHHFPPRQGSPGSRQTISRCTWPAAVGSHDHLKHLGALVRGPVDLGGAEQTDVVSESEEVHELGHKLLRRQTAQLPVFGRDEHIEAAAGHGQ